MQFPTPHLIPSLPLYLRSLHHHLPLLPLSPPLLDLSLDGTIQPRLQFGPIATPKQNLHPDEKGREKERLNQIIQQGRSAALKHAMPDKLRDPGGYKEGESVAVCCRRVGACQMVGVCGCAQEQGEEQGAGYGLHEDVKDGVENRGEGAEVEREGGEGEVGREGDEGGGVCALICPTVLFSFSM